MSETWTNSTTTNNNSVPIIDLRNTPNDALSSGQKQKLAIASAMAPHPALLAMDEPSSNLDEDAS